MYNEIGGYSCRLYYDTLYDKAYLARDGGLYETGTDFARYIDSFLENTDLTFYIDDNAATALNISRHWIKRTLRPRNTVSREKRCWEI